MPAACLVNLDELVVLALAVRSLVPLLDIQDYALLVGVLPLLLELAACCDLRHRLNERQGFGPLLELRQHL